MTSRSLSLIGMNRWHFCIITVCILSCIVYSNPSIAQTKQLEEVTADLGGGTFTSAKGLPFDVPFRIKGTVTPGLKKIVLTYKADPAESHLQWKDEGGRVIKWENTDDQKEWRLLAGPLHPNVSYRFTFTVTRALELSATVKDKFKSNAYALIETLFARPELIDATAITNTNSQLNNDLKALVPAGATIVDAGGAAFTIDINKQPFKSMVSEVAAIRFADISADVDFRTLQNVLISADFAGFRLRLSSMLNNLTQLTDDDKDLMNEPVDAGIEKYKAIKYRELGLLVTPANDKLEKAFKGEWTLKNNAWFPATAPDADLMNLLYSFFYRMHGNFKYKTGNPVFQAADLNVIKILLKVIPQIITIHAQNTKRDETRQKFLNKFPDILADLLIKVSYTFSDQSVVDAVSQNTPYIGLDFGLSYVPGYSQLFIYEGVNFYLVPVNKDAPLSSFKKRYWFLKRFSIHFGLTQNLIKVDNKRYAPLIENLGSVLLGSGFRINRIFRLNTGVMFFYEKDNNPLKEKKHLTILPQFSFTVDINVARALGRVGTNLGVPNP